MSTQDEVRARREATNTGGAAKSEDLAGASGRSPVPRVLRALRILVMALAGVWVALIFVVFALRVGFPLELHTARDGDCVIRGGHFPWRRPSVS